MLIATRSRAFKTRLNRIAAGGGVIAAPDFTVRASPTTGSVSPGQSAAFTFTVTPAAGYTGTVKFSCGTLHSTATCSFSYR
jgi:hypothetical protein